MKKKKRKHRNSIYFKQNCTLRNADFSGIELLNDYVFIWSAVFSSVHMFISPTLSLSHAYAFLT